MTFSLEPPGDKSISHRVLMLAPLATGESRVRGILAADDVRVTESAMLALGASIQTAPDGCTRIIGPTRWKEPDGEIDCANSGTSARLLTGLLAGLGIAAILRGDASLSDRPMDRVVYPLQAMGARIRYLEREGRLPIRLEARRSGSLRPLRHRPLVASAQVKSALLLAGLTARVRVAVSEPGPSRDHTERLLQAMGACVSVDRAARAGPIVTLEPAQAASTLSPLDTTVPGDFSSAAFLLAAAWLGAGEVRVGRVGLNPTRTGLLEVAGAVGARFEVEARGGDAGEPFGDVRAFPSRLAAFELDCRSLPSLIDEVPLLAVLAARATGTSRLGGAEELRVKESDRLANLARNLAAVGIRCREHADGLEVEGTDAPLAGRVHPSGDHRIAMAFGVLGTAGDCKISVEDRDCVSVSYPSFWRDLEAFTGRAAR